jgi:hypothetical protein
MTTAPAVQHSSSKVVKVLGGATAGLTTAMVTSSLLYLMWFVPLDRPGSHIPTTEEIIVSIKKPADPRSAEQLRADAESARTTKIWVARMIYTPFEIILLTSTCLVAAYMASLYGRAHDAGEGKGGGSLFLPTLIGTAAGAVVLWALFSVLVAQPAAAHPEEHAKPSNAPLPPSAYDHGSQPPLPATKDVDHDDHKTKDWSGWLADHRHPAQLTAYILGTLAAAIAGVLAPRVASRTAPKSAEHSYMPGT